MRRDLPCGKMSTVSTIVFECVLLFQKPKNETLFRDYARSRMVLLRALRRIAALWTFLFTRLSRRSLWTLREDDGGALLLWPARERNVVLRTRGREGEPCPVCTHRRAKYRNMDRLVRVCLSVQSPVRLRRPSLRIKVSFSRYDDIALPNVARRCGQLSLRAHGASRPQGYATSNLCGFYP